jgi:hypothetical protein
MHPSRDRAPRTISVDRSVTVLAPGRITLPSASVSTPDTAPARDAEHAFSSDEFRLSIATSSEFAEIEAFSRRPTAPR